MAIVGNFFTYTCKVVEIADDVTVREINWYRNGTELTADDVRESDGKITITGGRNSSELTVKNAMRADGVEYYCEVFLSNNLVEPLISEKHTLRVEGC